MEDDERSTESFWAEVAADSEARLSQPVDFALEALEDLFGNGGDAENGFRRFRMKLEDFFWWADDAVQCLELVAADPPPDLGPLIRARIGSGVLTAGVASETIGDDAAYLSWLRDVTARLRALFDAYVVLRTGSTGVE